MGAGHVACSSALEILRGNNRKEEMLNWDDSEGRNMTAGRKVTFEAGWRSPLYLEIVLQSRQNPTPVQHRRWRSCDAHKA